MGRRLRWVIESHLKVKHSEFAQMVGTTKQLVSRWVNDQDNPPGDKSIAKIAQVAGVSRAWLKYGQGSPTRADTGISSAVLVDVLRQFREMIDDIVPRDNGSERNGDGGEGLVMEVSDDCTVTRASRAWSEKVKLPVEQLVGSSVADLVDPTDSERVRWAVSSALSGPVSNVEFDARFGRRTLALHARRGPDGMVIIEGMEMDGDPTGKVTTY